MIRRAKLAALRLAKAGGVFRLVGRSGWRTRRLLILCYHGVSLDDEHLWDPWLYVAPDTLRRRLELLRASRCAVLPFAEAVRRLDDGTLPERAVAITFDDGAHDFHAAAFPLLREFDVPATVYLTTYYCAYQRPVFDPACSYILWKGRGRTVNLDGRYEGIGPLRLETDAARHDTFGRIYRFVRQEGLSAPEKDELLGRLAERLTVDYERILRLRMVHAMSPAEVAEVVGPLVDVQLHTHRHRTPRDRDLFVREIRDNRAAFDAMIPGRPSATHFCYPSGDWDPVFFPWLRAEGVATATTTIPGLAVRGGDPLLLPRFLDAQPVDPVEFEGWCMGASAWLPRRGS